MVFIHIARYCIVDGLIVGSRVAKDNKITTIMCSNADFISNKKNPMHWTIYNNWANSA